MSTIAFDLDDTLCFRPPGTGESLPWEEAYRQSVPFLEKINIVNELFDRGHYIIIYTARGMGTCKGDVERAYALFYNLAAEQLEKWGVKYHELILGKPLYDLFIDDKAMCVDDSRVQTVEEIEKWLR